jgi:enoyl-CoA hydratase
MSDGSPYVTLQRQGHVLIIAMSREAKRNAIDAQMTEALDVAFNELDDDPELWAGVLTGTTTVFSAGNDLKAGSGSPTERGGAYGLITRRRATPLIAAVEGYALGGGFELTLACDLVVASTTAVFGLPEVTRGVLAIYGGLFRTARALPLNISRELALTGTTLSAERAHSCGYVNQLTEPGQALPAAIELAESICANAPVSVQQSLQVINDIVGADDHSAWAAVAGARHTVLASQDLQEGLAAFAERRPPRWSGR